MDALAPYLPQLILAWSIHWLGVLSPGASVALILGVATRRGRGASLLTAFGVALGSTTLAIATVLGVAAVFATLTDVMVIIRYIGAAYLLWLAYKAFRTAYLLPPVNLDAKSERSVMQTAMAGYLLQVTNPKAIFFWLAIAAAGGVGDAPWPVVVLFVVGAFFNSFVGHGAYAVILSSTPFRTAYLAARHWIEGALGGFFTLFAFKLATERD